MLNLLMFVNSGNEGNQEKLILHNISYPNNPGYQTLVLMPVGLGNYQFSPLVWTVLDKTFISVTDGEDPSQYYIYVYDHFRNKVSDAIPTGLFVETTLDVHHIASIIGTKVNALLITETSFHGAAGNWKHSLTSGGYAVNDFDSWTDSGINEFTYHQLKIFANGNIYDAGRLASISSNYAYNDLYKSTDNGKTFSLVHRVFDWGVSPDTNRYIPYLYMIHSDDDIIRLYVNSLDYTWTGASTFIGGPRTYYLESADGGVTWRNINNTFSKDVVATSPLTLAEMNANMIMWDLGTATDIIRATGACLVDGNPYIVGGSGDVGDSPLALYYWSGSTWIQKIITCAGHTILPAYDLGNFPYFNNSIGIYQNGSNIELICTELVSAKAQMSRFQTDDNGDTWTFIEQFTTDDEDHGNAHINYNIGDKKMAACISGASSDTLFVKEFN